ncbi:CPXCG motif-containing cysteine-rich protein [Pukyongia salina]|uniref:CPXCG motif-containing cysteine-rich protein n=1 Tax=Pukyongia salina TaxID=2094025 RepID=A0A2S0HY51_9FLAO|nr:CPXCG motif-containing cysteine-rich protein [Pukyongia salina]AVI51113.1 CPXCG motif-containing cysteine-rich protein [Pukyongia salina]
MDEHFFQCPYCWEQISMLLDPSVSQTYIEDCEVCCNPIEISVLYREGQLEEFAVKIME